MVTGHVTVLTPTGRELGKMYPAKWFYRTREPRSRPPRSPSGASLAEDLYIVMAGFELGEQTASVEIHVNELVNWIWIGFGLLALGTGIALLPERVFAFAGARVGVEADGDAAAAVSLLLGAGERVRADHRHADRAVAARARAGRRGDVHLRLPPAGRRRAG